ncbi:MAG: TetR family transcriptional regulator [Desulfuromonadales bacterium]|nr:TetR family transcriptional regulator [Desulfuromonadales bacterium]
MSRPDKQHEIVSAALELIAKRGFHRTPMSMIAARAGVAAGTIYCYFKSKDELIHEIYVAIEKRIRAVLNEGDVLKKTHKGRFLHIGAEILRYFIAFPQDFRFLEQFHNSPFGVAYRRDNLLGNPASGSYIFKELFENDASQQTLKKLPISILFALFVGPLLLVARETILGFIELDEPTICRIVEACWDAVNSNSIDSP